jgi:polyprenyl P-hydroxybenzoate/phenylacrylic acid decarboxylase-like protein
MRLRRLILGLTGASGIVYGVRFLDWVSRAGDIEVHLLMTSAAKVTLAHEMGLSPNELERKAAVVHDVRNIAAPIASGSFRTSGMVVAPCSMKTLAAIANGDSGNLLTRAADVCLKERRPLILVPRETPLHIGHLRALVKAAEIGAVILPPLPGFYFHPRTIDDLVDHTVGKILDQLGFEHTLFKRWGES